MCWSRVALAGLTVVLAAYAGSIISAGWWDAGTLPRVLIALGAAMACGVAAALACYGDLERRGPDARDAGDTTVEIGRSMALTGSSAPAYGPLKTLGGFIAAASSLVVFSVAGLLWTAQRTAGGGDLTAGSEVAMAPVPAPDTVEDPRPTAMHANVVMPLEAGAGPVAVRTVLRTVDASRARRECLAQVESAHLFLGLARQAKTPGGYARTTNPQIKHMLEGRPIDPRTLQHIALRMWERRDAPDRGPEWWSAQYARCEEARVAGASYVVRG
jgi:hypothetical protein